VFKGSSLAYYVITRYIYSYPLPSTVAQLINSFDPKPHPSIPRYPVPHALPQSPLMLSLSSRQRACANCIARTSVVGPKTCRQSCSASFHGCTGIASRNMRNSRGRISVRAVSIDEVPTVGKRTTDLADAKTGLPQETLSAHSPKSAGAAE